MADDDEVLDDNAPPGMLTLMPIDGDMLRHATFGKLLSVEKFCKAVDGIPISPKMAAVPLLVELARALVAKWDSIEPIEGETPALTRAKMSEKLIDELKLADPVREAVGTLIHLQVALAGDPKAV